MTVEFTCDADGVALIRIARRDLAEALDLEPESFRSLIASADAHEGITAFAEKRQPVFQGR